MRRTSIAFVARGIGTVLFATIIGILCAIVPQFTSGASIGILLPAPAVTAYYLVLAIGGITALVGVLGKKPNFEVLGFTLIATTQFLNFYAIIDARGLATLVAAAAILVLAVDALSRAIAIQQRFTTRT